MSTFPPSQLPVDEADPTRLSITHLAPEAAQHLGLLPGPGTALAEAPMPVDGADSTRLSIAHLAPDAATHHLGPLPGPGEGDQ